jgi:hypothetical protein
MGSQLEFLLISGGRVDRVVPGAGYVNPLTVLSMVEAVRVHKSNVFIHTAAWKGPSREKDGEIETYKCPGNHWKPTVCKFNM